ncbi:carboxymuconolactone decarboxylase family protein [Methanoplanus sp. FWC-SCC4]|uniref:Carboxymuconolactone decarboxylase family protein n=1 Tax=Methanochimaera problematica TaxID=2609417 RepID=A0AA97I3M9_9EURY|nr:carboxymuconolactone decarboxylase family protein [Methanoplanus sp. FWC-SCC4]WOF15704.1 carboxymuconolactone decarboxylase family protein [Methanoplanus sp. FWC-SCC4]
MEFENVLSNIAQKGKEESAKEWLKNIEDENGTIPLIFQRMAKRPEVLISHLLYKGAVTETSTLDPKIVELISLAVGAALNCKHCTEYHMRAAYKRGATKDEILEVILLAGSLAQASVLADAYRVLDTNDEPCKGSCDLNGFSYKKQ